MRELAGRNGAHRSGNGGGLLVSAIARLVDSRGRILVPVARQAMQLMTDLRRNQGVQATTLSRRAAR